MLFINWNKKKRKINRLEQIQFIVIVCSSKTSKIVYIFSWIVNQASIVDEQSHDANQRHHSVNRLQNKIVGKSWEIPLI